MMNRNATGTLAPSNSMLPHDTAGDERINTHFAADGVCADLRIYFRAELACPRCKGPAERIQRRAIDRVLSWIFPVHRYRCRTMGWGCGWEGNRRASRAAEALANTTPT